ncbi:hypothetical protein NSQ19_02295 [Weizmannia sp. FSL W8-1119]|uniref:hypothetical protein n=1 Tax=Weizmannia sp. FSL W8-1119 TaxID=2954709 RepID=UPI0030F68FE2
MQIYLACTKTNETGKFLHTESLKVHLSNSRTPLYPYSWEIYLLTAFVIFSSRIQELLLKGGDEVIDAARAFKIIDSATARTFKSNSVKIGNFLKKFENAGANAANEVRTQLPVWFKDNTRVSKGVAENISIAVAWAIHGADWLFF